MGILFFPIRGYSFKKKNYNTLSSKQEGNISESLPFADLYAV